MTTRTQCLLAAAVLAATVTQVAAQKSPSLDPFLPFDQQVEAVARAADCIPERVDAPDTGVWNCAVGLAEDVRTFIIRITRDPGNPAAVSGVDLHFTDASNDIAFERRAVRALRSVLTSLDAPSHESVASAFMGAIPRAEYGRWSSTEAQWADDRRGLYVEVLLAGNAHAVQRRMRLEPISRVALGK